MDPEEPVLTWWPALFPHTGSRKWIRGIERGSIYVQRLEENESWLVSARKFIGTHKEDARRIPNMPPWTVQRSHCEKDQLKWAGRETTLYTSV